MNDSKDTYDILHTIRSQRKKMRELFTCLEPLEIARIMELMISTTSHPLLSEIGHFDFYYKQALYDMKGFKFRLKCCRE